MKERFATAVLFAALAAGACQEASTADTCKGIPEGGCPLSHGAACDDPACIAAYACTPSGAWKLDHACPPRVDAGGVDLADASDARVPRDVSIDVPGANGGPGCANLEPPDCPLGLAVLCGDGCCGCEDLFVCTDGGWNPWGTCEGGTIGARDR